MRQLQIQLAVLLVSMVVMGWMQLAAAQDQVVPSDRVTNFVKVREDSSSDSPKIGELRPGQSLPLIRSVPRWHEVRLADGMPGFVSKSWTRVVPTPLGGADDLVIHFLSVGAGTCTLVECPGADAPPMLIDCGSTSGSGGDMALELDEATPLIQGILSNHTAAPNVVLTHGHEDHYNWIPTILADRMIGHFWRGGVADRYSLADFPTWLDEQSIDDERLHEGFEPDWHNDGEPIGDELSCGLASTFVLNVNTVGSTSANSLMLMIEYGDFTAIFPGDAPGITEDKARANFAGALKATVLAGSHHGASSHNSNDQDWADATAPEVVVYSSGTRHGHPRCDAVGSYNNHLATVSSHPTHCNDTSTYSARQISDTARAEYVTDVQGTVVVSTSGQSPLTLTCDGATGCNEQIAF